MKKTLVLLFVFAVAGGQAATAQTTERASRQISNSPHVIRVGPRTTYLKEGMNTEDVLKALGRPVEVSERVEDGTKIVSYVFRRGDDRVLVAEFVRSILVRSRVETRGDGLRAEVVNF